MYMVYYFMKSFFVNFDFEVVMDGNINQNQIYANFVTI